MLTSGFRVVFDSDSLVYYLAPLVCCLLVLGLYDPIRIHRSAVIVAVTGLQFLLAYEPLFHHIRTLPWWLSGVLGGALEVAFIGSCVLGWQVARSVDPPLDTVAASRCDAAAEPMLLQRLKISDSSPSGRP